MKTKTFLFVFATVVFISGCNSAVENSNRNTNANLPVVNAPVSPTLLPVATVNTNTVSNNADQKIQNMNRTGREDRDEDRKENRNRNRNSRESDEDEGRERER